MKKKLTLIILIIMFIPLSINASEVEIKTHVQIDGKELEKDEFTFVLKDKDGEVLQTTTNDENGDILFDPFEANTDANESIYIIEEVNSKKEGYTYDKEIIYVKVDNNTGKPLYYKNNTIEEQMKKEVPKYEPKEAYHATEEELKGEAYAVYDTETKEVYFRRYDSTKDNDFEWPFANITDESINSVTIGTKKYFRYVEEEKNYFSSAIPWEVKKIVFEDAIKPKFNNGTGLFGSRSYLEYIDVSRLDTSNITIMTYMFDNFNSEKLDLSTFETSQVTDMNMMFQNDSNLKELDLRSFSADSLTNTINMFANCTSLTDLKISSKFRTEKLATAQSMFYNTRSLELADFSWFVANEDTILLYTFQYSGVKYLDLSHWNFENKGKLETTFDFNALDFGGNLIYLDISNLTSPICGAYRSNDFRFQKQPAVIKTNPHYNFKYSTGGFTYYNVDSGEFTYDLGPYDTCSYNYGGIYLNIQDEEGEVLFVNKYTEPQKEEEAPKNPETKDIVTFVLLISILSIGLVIAFNSKRASEI